MNKMIVFFAIAALFCRPAGAEEWPKPYSPPCTERENVFAFTEKPAVKPVGKDRYEITFAVKAYCDVTVGIIDEAGKVVRHLGAGVLGRNAPAPFQKNSLRQTIYWNGKDDLDVYHPHPETLRVQVRLGLKPEFDKRLGGTSAKNVPGYIFGIAIDESGAYVFIKGAARENVAGFNHTTVRKFDRDGNYICTIFPPPANMPLSKLAGTGFIEYEKGKRAWHGHNVNDDAHGFLLPGADGKGLADCQVAIVGNRLVYVNAGGGAYASTNTSRMHWIYKDGSTDLAGQRGTRFAWGAHFLPKLAASPDGKWIYMVASESFGDGFRKFDPVVVRAPSDGSARATVFAGERRAVGHDNAHFNGPFGIDCDAQGRVYVSDLHNNRIQVFAQDGKYLKTIKIDRPRLIRIHQKTGAIYVQHGVTANVYALHYELRRGRRVTGRLTKLTSFENPKEEFHVDGLASSVMAIDSWSKRPRLWLAGSVMTTVSRGKTNNTGSSVRIYEERGKTLRKIVDFDEDAKKEAGDNYIGRWGGEIFDKVVCDPTREQLYYKLWYVFDLKTGRFLGRWKPEKKCSISDMAFDKRGYLHIQFNPTSRRRPGVGRVDPSRAREIRTSKSKTRVLVYPEVPYDHGVEKWGWTGIIPSKCQPGAKGFQEGMGVNMQGDVAINSNIFYVPRMEKSGWERAASRILARAARGEAGDAWYGNYANYLKSIRELQKRGEAVYFIKRQPGLPISGATVWTYNSSGELRMECAAIAGKNLNGVQIDEDGSIYFATSRVKLYGGKHFLYGRGGTLGDPKDTSNLWPFTGTLIKSKPNTRVKIILRNAVIPTGRLPQRPPELLSISYPNAQHSQKSLECWVEGAEWLYAGVSPMVPTGCLCYRQHFALDWYKRVYVPESYRHSIGVLDTNGNLILHIGQYGNFDSASGPQSKVPVGGDGIGLIMPRFLSVTDNYLAFGDWDERLMVLILNYHAEATAKIK